MADPKPKPTGIGSATVPKAAPGSQDSIAAQYARAKAARDAEALGKVSGKQGAVGKGEGKQKSTMERLNDRKKRRFGREWIWVLAMFCWFLWVIQTSHMKRN